MSKIEIKSKEITFVPIEQIIEHPKNANRHSVEQIDRLCKLIKYQGFRSPLIISKRSGFLVSGHGRLMSAKKLGLKELPCVYQEFESEAQEYAYVISENEIARWAELDKQAVYDELDKIDVPDIELLGLEDFELPTIEELEPQTDEDEVPEVDDPITKRGDIWLLGKHRLCCGDSTMIDDVEKLMNGEKADMVFTDPPYGMKLKTDWDQSSQAHSKNGKSWNGKKKNYDEVIGDHEDFSEDLIHTILTFDYVKEMFIFGADYFAELLPNKNDGSWVVWDKRVTENFDKVMGSSFELCWSKVNHKRDIARIRWCGIYGTEKEHDHKRLHPTQKPVELITWFFEKWCKDLKKCVDLYGGSGSTLLGCEKHNKECYTMELDEKYCDVIINRWQNYTGKQAVLESTGETYNSLKDKNEQLKQA
jgi:DNA modification methylase